jgi:aspartokinase
LLFFVIHPRHQHRTAAVFRHKILHLAEAGLNIEMISTSEIRISIICRESDLEKGVRAAHTAFGLDADQVEAVVYGGTGR